MKPSLPMAWIGRKLVLAATSTEVHRLRRRTFWGMAHAVSILRIRRHAVVTAILLCWSATILLTLTTKPVYSSSVIIKVPDGFCTLCGDVHPKDECPLAYVPW